MPGGETVRRRMPRATRVAAAALAVALTAALVAGVIVAPGFPRDLAPFVGRGVNPPKPAEHGARSDLASTSAAGEVSSPAAGQPEDAATREHRATDDGSALSDAPAAEPGAGGSARHGGRANSAGIAPGAGGQRRDSAALHDASAGWAMPDVEPVPDDAPAGIAGKLVANPPISIGTAAVRVDPAVLPLLPRVSQAEQAVLAETIAMGGLLPTGRILAYYGHPHDPNMGILGEYGMADLLGLLRAEATTYEAADPTRPVIPAFEVIATVAQGWPAQDGQYLLDTDLETLTEYADFAEANGMLLFLDLQIGRNTVPAEIEKVRSLLERPHVHLALDPEFAVAEGQVPGTHLGELTAEQVNEAQEILAGIVREGALPPKILIVHQFREDMILGKERLRPVAGVQLVIESDGFGSPGVKTEVYDALIRDDGFEYAGIKHFYTQDVPVMTAAETLALDPAPLVVIYQ